ncbi:transporter substrate-binding domain-containing protein [Vibrio sp. JC009]|uniref:substrate-binding periplasmic protein n=1 Tax=Vibrio sp. JC009 TaxID=2912314 RepID=UPI0023B1621C|nr:transporter substrate-binding domain-containing protein [Vibrio sp. JC009]WED20836.1 transporter substrate-binding domain-containing protein [Vibrio sp. JC009]
MRNPLCLFLLLIPVLFSSFLSAKEGKTINITSGEWPPYLSSSLKHGGFAAHIVSEAFAAVGVKVKYGYYPWKRSYNYALKGEDIYGGKWNGTVVWVKTPEREQDFYYSDPVIIDDEVLFFLKEKGIQWENVNDLKGLKIGGTAHTAYPIFDEAIKRGIITLERGGNYDALLKRVYHQKIDAAPLVKHVGFYYLTKSFSVTEALSFTYSPTVIETRQYHLILSKQKPENQEYIKLFNQGLKKIRANGLYSKLYSRLENGFYSLPLRSK